MNFGKSYRSLTAKKSSVNIFTRQLLHIHSLD